MVSATSGEVKAAAIGPRIASAEDATDSPMRPFDLKMQPTPSTGSSKQSDVSTAVVPSGSCIFWQGDTYPDKKAYIGLTMMQPSATWTSSFAYTQTNTSSFQTGWTAGGSAQGSGFTIGGSEVTASTSEFGGNSTVTSNKNAPVVARHWITVHMNHNQWRCWNSNTPPPANHGMWPRVDTLEPGRWVRDFSHDPGALPACATNVPSRQFLVGAHSGVHRNNGSSTSLSNSISGTVTVTNSNVSFSLGAQVQDNYAFSNLIAYAWQNNSSNSKRLCGVDGPIMGNSRVVALS
jgi:hypothetical protein